MIESRTIVPFGVISDTHGRLEPQPPDSAYGRLTVQAGDESWGGR